MPLYGIALRTTGNVSLYPPIRSPIVVEFIGKSDVPFRGTVCAVRDTRTNCIHPSDWFEYYTGNKYEQLLDHVRLVADFM